MGDSDNRVRIDKWLWAGAPDPLAIHRPFAGRGALGGKWIGQHD